MTVLVGVAHEGQVYLGADRGVSDTNFLVSTLSRKVKKLGPQLAVAYSGSGGAGLLVHNITYQPPVADNLEVWLYRDFLGVIRDAADTARLNTSDPEKASADLLLAACGRLFEVSTTDWSAFEHHQIATGSGFQYALGSLHSTRTWDDPRARVREAVQAAIAFSPECAKPVDLVVV